MSASLSVLLLVGACAWASTTALPTQSATRRSAVSATTTFRPMIVVESPEEQEGTSLEAVSLDHEWSCGSDGFSMLIAEGTIDKDCPELKNEVNNCCFAHDNCYDKQLGRKLCDDTFCNCLQNATVNNHVCHTDDGPLFCHLVRELGEQAYINSAPNATHSSDLIKSLLDVEGEPTGNTTNWSAEYEE